MPICSVLDIYALTKRSDQETQHDADIHLN